MMNSIQYQFILEQEGNLQMSHKKAVIIDVKESVGEIASIIWPVV